MHDQKRRPSPRLAVTVSTHHFFGFSGVYSQTWKKFDRSCPEICSLSAMNSSVVAVAVPVLGGPGAQDLEERLVADLLPQRLERHRPAPVDRAGEHGVPLRIGHDDVPEGVVRLAAVVQLEVRPGRFASPVCSSHRYWAKRREALVQPDVASTSGRTRGRRTTGARARARSCSCCARPSRAACLRLQREADRLPVVGRVVRDRAGRVERVGARTSRPRGRSPRPSCRRRSPSRPDCSASSVGSIATVSGMPPGVVPFLNCQWPMSAVAR